MSINYTSNYTWVNSNQYNNKILLSSLNLQSIPSSSTIISVCMNESGSYSVSPLFLDISHLILDIYIKIFILLLV